jgi:hypothetical protein
MTNQDGFPLPAENNRLFVSYEGLGEFRGEILNSNFRGNELF